MLLLRYIQLLVRWDSKLSYALEHLSNNKGRGITKCQRTFKYAVNLSTMEDGPQKYPQNPVSVAFKIS